MERTRYLRIREAMEEAIEVLDSAWLSQHQISPGVYQTGPEHTVRLRIRGCDTTRECFCVVTGGRDHDLETFPLVASNGETY